MLPPEIERFLSCPTPQRGIGQALAHREFLPIDHADREKKTVLRLWKEPACDPA